MPITDPTPVIGTPFGVSRLGVNGNIVMSGALYQASDERVKKNFGQINNARIMLRELNPVTYEFDTTSNLVVCNKVCGVRDSLNYHTEVRHCFPGGKRMGFKAQEVEKVVPEAVIKGTDSTIFYVDHTMLIPILTKALKEQDELVQSQQKQLDQLSSRLKDLEKSLSKCCEAQITPKPKAISIDPNDTGTSTISKVAQLEQNAPNPFNSNSLIKYYVPSDASFAQIIITDSQGKVVKTAPVQNGYGEVVVHANTLNVGVYYYTLIIDGQPFATRSMVITN